MLALHYSKTLHNQDNAPCLDYKLCCANNYKTNYASLVSMTKIVHEKWQTVTKRLNSFSNLKNTNHMWPLCTLSASIYLLSYCFCFLDFHMNTVNIEISLSHERIYSVLYEVINIFRYVIKLYCQWIEWILLIMVWSIHASIAAR